MQDMYKTHLFEATLFFNVPIVVHNLASSITLADALLSARPLKEDVDDISVEEELILTMCGDNTNIPQPDTILIEAAKILRADLKTCEGMNVNPINCGNVSNAHAEDMIP